MRHPKPSAANTTGQTHLTLAVTGQQMARYVRPVSWGKRPVPGSICLMAPMFGWPENSSSSGESTCGQPAVAAPGTRFAQ